MRCKIEKTPRCLAAHHDLQEVCPAFRLPHACNWRQHAWQHDNLWHTIKGHHSTLACENSTSLTNQLNNIVLSKKIITVERIRETLLRKFSRVASTFSRIFDAQSCVENILTRCESVSLENYEGRKKILSLFVSQFENGHWSGRSSGD